MFTYFTTIGAEIKVEVVYIKTYISDGFIDDGWMNGMHLPHVHGNTHGLCSFVVMFILLERVKEVVWLVVVLHHKGNQHIETIMRVSVKCFISFISAI